MARRPPVFQVRRRTANWGKSSRSCSAPSARIGEVLAIRKCDVDVTGAPSTVVICGTIVFPRGGRPLANRIRRRRRQRGCFPYPASRLRCCGSGSSSWLMNRLITCSSSAATTRLSRRTTSVGGCAACCRRWESRESHHTRSLGPSRLSSIAPAVRIWPRRCSATARLRSRRSTTSSQTRK